VGVAGEELRAEAVHAELDRLSKDVCGRPELRKLADLSLTLQVEGTGPGRGQWWLRLIDGSCDSGAGTVENPDLTLTVAAEDLLAIARKEADPRALWETGRLKASGDLSLLRRLGDAAVGLGR
jgi:hypothetical protein